MEPDQLSELLDQRTFRSLKNPGEVIHAKSIQWGDHRQPPDDLWDQAERFEVFRLHLPQQPISRHLAVFRHLTEPEPILPSRLAMISSSPTNAPPQMNRTLVVSKGTPG